jgi:hypothetical protein
VKYPEDPKGFVKVITLLLTLHNELVLKLPLTLDIVHEAVLGSVIVVGN